MEHLIGDTGPVYYDYKGDPWAYIQGDRWQIESREHLSEGDQVEVISVHGLVLKVRPVSTSKEG
jgi:membrane-bound ClpP family serine protease